MRTHAHTPQIKVKSIMNMEGLYIGGRYSCGPGALTHPRNTHWLPYVSEMTPEQAAGELLCARFPGAWSMRACVRACVCVSGITKPVRAAGGPGGLMGALGTAANGIKGHSGWGAPSYLPCMCARVAPPLDTCQICGADIMNMCSLWSDLSGGWDLGCVAFCACCYYARNGAAPCTSSAPLARRCPCVMSVLLCPCAATPN